MDRFDSAVVDNEVQESADALLDERREKPPVEPFDPYFGRRRSRSGPSWTATFPELTSADEAA
jgi:hypothetical protein